MIAAASLPHIQFSHLPKPPLSAILAKLVADASDALDGDRDMARMLLQQAAQLLQSTEARSNLPAMRPAAQTALAPWQARRVVDHINDNLARSLPLHELAKVARLSDSHFCRAFKGAFGQTPHAFIIDRRLERARQEMLESEEHLARIAASCGFADQAHLARLFRRAMGVAPSEWRRANRSGIDRRRGG